MRQQVFACLFSAATFAVVPSYAVAQVDAVVSGEDWLWQQIYSVLRNHPNKEILLKKMDAMYLYSENDGIGGISERDHELSAQLVAVARRREFLSKNWLPYDFDADGVVTREEIETISRNRAIKNFKVSGVSITPTPDQLVKVQQGLARKVLESFGEGLERVTLQDAIKAADAQINRHQAGRRNLNLLPLSLDRDGDSIVSREEFNAEVLKTLDAFDINGDGEIDKGEVAARQTRPPG